MRPPLEGTILITGASSGIGRAMARQLAPEATRLILVARRVDRLEALAEELRTLRDGLEVRVEPCDLAVPAAVDRLLDAVATVGVDVLINNAGLGDLGLFERSDADKLDAMIAVNIQGLVRLTRGLVPGMVARQRGGILNVSSGFGLTWMPGAAAYIGTKHFVSGFTESLRSELAPCGVVVTQVCPGPVDTEFEEQAGNPVGRPPPAIMTLSAERCAADALTAFRAGRARVVPGWFPALVIRLGLITPQWVFRLVYAPAARALRRLGAP